MFKVLRQLARDRKAATAVEYGLILAVIVLVMFVSLKAVASTTIAMWNDVNGKVATATGY